MTSASVPVETPRTGAWAGLAVAARGTYAVAASCVPLFAVGVVTALANLLDRAARDNPHEVDMAPVSRLIDLYDALASALRPLAVLGAVSGAAVGVLLFFAGTMLLFGSSFGRVAARVLLAVDALHSIGVTVAFVGLLRTRLADWAARHDEAVAAFAAAAPRARGALPTLDVAPSAAAVALVVWGLLGLAVVAWLFRLAGRPAVRQWCAARAGRG